MKNPDQESSQVKGYTPEELAFMAGIEEYKKSTGRKFPSWTEVLSVAKGLGYVRRG